MKTDQRRTRAPVQRDLFDSSTTPAVLAGLQLHHDELVELLSQLLWQVARRSDAEHLESNDEQDQP